MDNGVMQIEEVEKKYISESIIQMLSQISLYGKVVGIFGCTKYCGIVRDILLENKVGINIIIDNDRGKIGQSCLGLPVISPQEFVQRYKKAAFVFICSQYGFEMQKQLEDYGYIEGLNFCNINLDNTGGRCRDSFGCFITQAAKVSRGYFLYRKILKPYMDKGMLFVCPYPGTGDVYVAGLFLNQYLKKEGIKQFVVAVLNNAGKMVGELYGWEHIIVISKTDMQVLLNTYQFFDNGRLKIKPLLYWGWRVKRHLYIAHYPNLTFADMLRYDVFGLEEDVLPNPPARDSDLDFVEVLFTKFKLRRNRTVILVPYAGSFTSNIPMGLWNMIVRELKKKEYCVCTNSLGDSEPAIDGTIPLNYPLNKAKEVLEAAGSMIAIRSGFCDVVSSAECRQFIIYEQGLNASSLNFFSLTKMAINTNAVELVYDGSDILTLLNDIVRYF